VSPARSQRARTIERYIYGTTAVLFVLVVFAGFARTYYLRGLFTAAPLPSLALHLHGLVMTAWVLLFAIQVSLIPAGRVRWHRRLGYGGVALSVLVLIVGLWVALRAAKYGTTAPPPFSQPAFLIVPLGDLILFALFFGGAVYYRRHPATHKRLMLLTVLNFLPPAVGRLPVQTVQQYPLGSLLTIILAAVGACVAFDLWRDGRVHRLFVAGAILLVVSFPVRIVLMSTPAWVNLAAWLASFA
jgi:hypothetical protein